MKLNVPGIASLLDDLGIAAQEVRLLTIGMRKAEMPGFKELHAYEALSGPEDLPKTLRVDLAIVNAPLRYLSQGNAESLLSRLRDVHCEKVLLLDSGARWNPDELRSLGFLEVMGPQVDGRCYLFDPDMFNQPREWNNPSNWANPENFRKYRW
jgi:hypothetical protein